AGGPGNEEPGFLAAGDRRRLEGACQPRRRAGPSGAAGARGSPGAVSGGEDAMTEPGRPPEHDVDALVRAHLRRQAEQVYAGAMLAKIKARRGAAAAASVPFRFTRRRLLWAVAVAAAVVAGFFLGGWWMSPAQAGAETLVREARDAHAV